VAACLPDDDYRVSRARKIVVVSPPCMQHPSSRAYDIWDKAGLTHLYTVTFRSVLVYAMKSVSWSVRFLTMILVVFVLIAAQEPPPHIATTTTTTTPKEECVVGDDGTCVDQEQVQATNPQEEIVDKNCPDRGHIIRCTGETLDLNKNGKLDRVELDTAIASLPW
jgi:hypothetical protein